MRKLDITGHSFDRVKGALDIYAGTAYGGLSKQVLPSGEEVRIGSSILFREQYVPDPTYGEVCGIPQGLGVDETLAVSVRGFIQSVKLSDVVGIYKQGNKRIGDDRVRNPRNIEL